MSRFKINNDLYQPQFSDANAFHFFLSFLLSLIIFPPLVWLIGLLWEVSDGFKKWYYEAPPYIRGASLLLALKKKSWRIFWNWAKKETLYSDKFSLQDVFIWDLGGCICGAILKWLI